MTGVETDGHATSNGWKAVGFCFVMAFTAELVLKLFAFGWLFFTEGWNVFDFFIVTISLVEGILYLLTSDDDSGGQPSLTPSL